MKTSTKEKKLVYLLEDDKIFALSICQSLENAYYKVIHFKDWQQMKACMDTVPDLILLDYFLSDTKEDAINGMTVLQELNASKISAPVIMLTSLQDMKTAVKLLQAGAVDYIIKDATFYERLLFSIKNVLAFQALKNELKSTRRQNKKLKYRLAGIFLIAITFTLALYGINFL